LLAPNTPAADAAQAVELLRRTRNTLPAVVGERFVAERIAALRTEQVEQLAMALRCKWVSGGDCPLVVDALVGLLGRLRLDSPNIAAASAQALRHAAAGLDILEVLRCLDRVGDDELAWFLDRVIDESAGDVRLSWRSRIYFLVHEWCIARTDVSDRVAAYVVALREDEDDSPLLDKLVAWLAPTPERMFDLACWQNGLGCLDEPYREAAKRWQAGDLDAVRDAEVLELLERYGNVAYVERAAKRDPRRTREALDGARDLADRHPVINVILQAWARATEVVHRS